jgi:hypothetical protein
MPSGQSVEDKGVYIKSQETSNDSYQRVREDFIVSISSWLKGRILQWSVTRQPNGLYLIQSAGEGTLYLACREAHTALGDSVTGLPTTFLWDLRPFGSGITWSSVVALFEALQEC